MVIAAIPRALLKSFPGQTENEKRPGPRTEGNMGLSQALLYWVDRGEFRIRLARRPNSIRFEELEQLLDSYGRTLDRSRGSHFVFRRGQEKLVIPLHRPHLLAVYVREVLRRTGEDDENDR